MADAHREITQHMAARKARATARRQAAHTAAEPAVRLLNDGRVVAVALCGNRGRDREMLLDVEDWEDIKGRWGTRWVVEPQGAAMGMCVTPEGADPVWPLLAHVIGTPPDGHRIVLDNRSLLDMRASNRHTVTRDVWMRMANPFPRLPQRPEHLRGEPTGTRERTGRARAGAPPRPARRSTPTPSLRPHSVLRDGKPCMAVPLANEHGAGKVALVDLLDFERLELLIGVEGWSVDRDSQGTPAVVSGRGRARMMAGRRDGSAGRLRIARFNMDAEDGHVVSPRNGDHMDLRRQNLMIETRHDHFARTCGRSTADTLGTATRADYLNDMESALPRYVGSDIAS